jgi:hypothetical protein
MKLLKKCTSLLIMTTLMMALGRGAAAAQHVVDVQQLRQKMIDSSTSRQEDLRQLQAFFASSAAAKALSKSHIAPAKVEQALHVLDDSELARLAERSRTVQKNFSAGALSNQELTYIVIALATAVIILVIVAAD